MDVAPDGHTTYRQGTILNTVYSGGGIVVHTRTHTHTYTHTPVEKRKKEKTRSTVLGGSVVKNSPTNAGDTGSILGPGRSNLPQGN